MFMPADAGQILRQMSGIRLLLHPAHHAAQFLADLFDQVLGLHTALCQEVDLAAALRLLFTLEYLFVSLFLHFRFSLETEMCSISVSRRGITATSLQCHIYLPIHFTYAE